MWTSKALLMLSVTIAFALQTMQTKKRKQTRLSFDEIFFSVLHGEIIEDYPTDKPYPSCLIYGESFAGEPIHSVWAYNPVTQWAVLVTVYRPDPDRWINWRIRRKQ
ncbi:MAG: DUF4258 domain-containing protein [Roseiflexaceae bacterium]|nr:DUF4258 domain-containing protein [Roseiflexaceae bacterium]